MTSAAPSLVEAVVEIAPEHVPLAELHVGEFSPGGFQVEELDGGGARFAVYLPIGDEHRLELHLVRAGVPVVASHSQIVPSDWHERWKEFHQPVVIGDLWVGPPWQEAAAPPGLKRVVIEPGQGFGTGAHPTTRLVLSLLGEQPRASVLDLGCGSGVLAIAASMLGFAPVLAVDNDPAAVQSARENVERNRLVHDIEVDVLDALTSPVPHADIVLANITLDPLVRIAPQLTAPRVIVSGLLKSQAEACAHAFEDVGYVLRDRRDRDGWVALVLDDAREGRREMQHRSVF